MFPTQRNDKFLRWGIWSLSWFDSHMLYIWKHHYVPYAYIKLFINQKLKYELKLHFEEWIDLEPWSRGKFNYL